MNRLINPRNFIFLHFYLAQLTSDTAGISALIQ